MVTHFVFIIKNSNFVFYGIIIFFIMDFSFKPNVTKNFILANVSQEAIFEYYLNLPVKKGLFKSPLRKDNHPTCSYFNKAGNIYFHDFATNEKLSCFAIVMQKYNCTFYQALEIIANDFGLVSSKKPTMKAIEAKNTTSKLEEDSPSSIQITQKEFSKAELKWWEDYGITNKILKKFGIYSCKYVFLNGKLFAESTDKYPIYGYYLGKNENGELWRIYFHYRKQFRFLSNTPAKKIQGFKQLPETGPVLVITKSMKDVACLYSLGIAACAPNSETLFIEDKVLEQLKSRFKRIIVLFDNDRAGMFNMAKIRRQHPELIYTMLPKDKAKDISDFYKLYGREVTVQLIKDFVKWLKVKLRQS